VDSLQKKSQTEKFEKRKYKHYEKNIRLWKTFKEYPDQTMMPAWRLAANNMI